MDTTEVLERLSARGVVLVADGQRLRFRPREAVTPDLRAALVEHKAELLRLLGAEQEEIRWRAEAMRLQLRPTGPIPFLVARRPGLGGGGCLSCGSALTQEQTYRCAPCGEAARAALRELREGDER